MPRRLPRPSFRPSAGIAAAAALACVAAAGACARPAPHFSERNARAHVNQLAGAIGSRPAGTDANRRAREYVAEQLRFFGFTVRVQSAEGRRPEMGLTGRVENVIAIRPGRRADALGLVAHYDSAPATPGAGDDAAGVAVALESARLLANLPREHTLMVLLTDAEEHGLLGAAAAVADPEVRSRLKAYINLEAIGADAPATLFQAGPGNGWLLRTWAQAAPNPHGSSYHGEVYERLPNDTDFTIFARRGIPGLNVALVGDSYPYHSSRDAPERLTVAALEAMGQTVVATLTALDTVDIAGRSTDQPIYFDIAGVRAVAFAAGLGRGLTVLAVVIGVIAWVRVLGVILRLSGGAGAARTAIWGLAGVLVVAGALVGASALLRASREVYHPWYAHPARYWTLLGFAGVFASELLIRLGGHLPAWLRATRHPAAVWMLALPAWIGLAVFVEGTAPAAAYLWSIPLLAAGAVVAAAPGSTGAGGRLAATLILGAAGALWLGELREMLRFAVPMLGRLPIVTPIVVLPAALAAVALVLAPPLVALVVAGPPVLADAALPLARRRLRALMTPALLLAVTGAFGAAYFSEAYTAERPLWRAAQYVADHAAGRATWEVGGIEPGLDVDLGRGAPSGWEAARGDLPGGPPVPPLNRPFTFRARAALEPPPVAATLAAAAVGDELHVRVRAQPAEPGLTLIVALPPGLRPRRASLPGIARGRDGWWTAAYAAAPLEGMVFDAAFAPEAAAALGGIRVGAAAPGLPGGSGWLRQPGWLGAARTVWSARQVHLVVPAPVAPGDPLR